MQITNRVIHLAKDRALSEFSVLVQRMVANADDSIKQSVSSLGVIGDQKSLSAARQLLRDDGSLLVDRLQTAFCNYLERAMQTMYTDLRAGLHNVSADHLSLIDDETVNRQIEVERLVMRLRDADRENLGHLNLVIAQLHADHNVRERENPFRPYLLARSLHEVIRGMAGDPGIAKVLFDLLSTAMTTGLSEYYGAIREVFEANGVRTKLVARPSAPSRPSRDIPGQQPSASGFVNTVSGAAGTLGSESAMSHKGLPSLQGNHAPSHLAQATQSAAFQDFVWQLFNQARSSGYRYNQGPQNPLAQNRALANEKGAEVMLPAASSSLLSQLKQYQQLAARGQAVNDQISPDHNQLFSVREQIGSEQASERERATIEVMARLFEFILQDKRVPADWRAQIGRLQIPFLKAAVLAPELLQQASHPARQLLNRMGTFAVAAGLAPDAPIDQAIESEVIDIISKILENFDSDMSIFADCLEQCNQSLAQHLRHGNITMTHCIEAIEEAEKTSIVLANTVKTLHTLLAPLNVDPQVRDFVMRTWIKVLMLALCNKKSADSTSIDHDIDFRAVLADLVWSVQEKQTPQERNALIRLLPDLVKRLKKGLELIRLPEQESKRAMDELVAVHARVLRSSQVSTVPALPSLEDLHQHFSSLATVGNVGPSVLSEPIRIPTALLESMLAKRRISAKVATASDAVSVSIPDVEKLMQLSMCMELGSADSGQIARLSWISTYRSLYVFKARHESDPIIYSLVSLSQALRDGIMRPIESAALFERAAESVMAEVEITRATQG
jgi:hypothetical protein